MLVAAVSDQAILVPAAAVHVWQAFWELDAARNGNGWDAFRLTFVDLAAWSEVNRREWAEWEVRALFRMDRERLASIAPGAPKVSERPVTAELFDALF